MRKSTFNLIIGILLGIVIVKVSDIRNDTGGDDTTLQPTQSLATTNPIKSNLTLPSQNDKKFFDSQIAHGLQIIKVPPPLDLNGRHPYQCYINGKSVSLPIELVEEIICEHGDPSESDPTFNVHNFTGNLKYVTTTE